MDLTKGFLQATIVVLWAVYAVVQIVNGVAGVADGPADPTGGADLLVGFLKSLPVESLVVPTAAMAAGLLGLEVVFVALRRYGTR